MKIVRICWVDIWSDPNWMGEAEALALKPQECETVGHLLSKDDNKVVLAGTYAPNAHGGKDQQPYGELIVLPMGCVTRIEYLGTKK